MTAMRGQEKGMGCPLTNQMFTVVLPEVRGEKVGDGSILAESCRKGSRSHLQVKGRLRKPSSSSAIRRATPTSSQLCEQPIEVRTRESEELLMTLGERGGRGRREGMTRSQSACAARVRKGVTGQRGSQGQTDFGNYCLTASGLEVSQPRVRLPISRKLRLSAARTKPSINELRAFPSDLSISSLLDLGHFVHSKLIKQSQLVGLFKYHSNSKRFRSISRH